MAGRKAKPSHLKMVQGHAGHRPINKAEPTSDPKLPEPPQTLSARAKEIFLEVRERLIILGYASASHTEGLALLANRLEEVERCNEKLQGSLTYDTCNSVGETVYKPYPEVDIRNQAARHAHSLLAEFGLTPAAATKIVVPGKQKKNAFSAL